MSLIRYGQLISQQESDLNIWLRTTVSGMPYWQSDLKQAIEKSRWGDASFTYQGIKEHKQLLGVQYVAIQQTMGRHHGHEELEQVSIALQLLDEIIAVFNSCGHDSLNFSMRL